MDISIDMLSLGNANGLIVWLKDGSGSFVIVIDGGNSDDGQKIINHMEKYILPYVAQSAPNLVVATHPDKDHVGGLSTIIQHYGRTIGLVWVHDPAAHMVNSLYPFLKRELLLGSARESYKTLLETLTDLEDFISTVDRYRIPRNEPFWRVSLGSLIRVLGPTQQFYQHLLPTFENLEDYLQQRVLIYTSRQRETVDELFEEILDGVEPLESCPVVDEENETSSINQSSAVIEITAGQRRYIFPADVGVAGLCDIQTRCPLNDIAWLAVPHHGSRRNLTSELINIMSPELAYISASGSKKHPRKALVNCLKKHGGKVYSTHKSGNLWHHYGDFPTRSDYTKAEPL